METIMKQLSSNSSAHPFTRRDFVKAAGAAALLSDEAR